MASPLKVQSNRGLGLEIWAIGTWDELQRHRAQLTAIGLLAEVGNPHAMAGADAGRFQQYIRVKVRGAA